MLECPLFCFGNNMEEICHVGVLYAMVICEDLRWNTSVIFRSGQNVPSQLDIEYLFTIIMSEVNSKEQSIGWGF